MDKKTKQALQFHYKNGYFIKCEIKGRALEVLFPPAILNEPYLFEERFIYNPTSNGLDIYGDKRLELHLPSYAIKPLTVVDLLLSCNIRKLNFHLMFYKEGEEYINKEFSKNGWNVECDRKLERSLFKYAMSYWVHQDDEKFCKDLYEKAQKNNVHKGLLILTSYIKKGKVE